MAGGHTVAAFDAELTALHSAIDRMAGLVEEQFALALDALATADAAKAATVVEGDAAIDRLEGEIEAMTIRMLALRQPMAKDLRDIVAALKIASNLERMGDFAGSVAKRAVTLAGTPDGAAGWLADLDGAVGSGHDRRHAPCLPRPGRRPGHRCPRP